MPPHVLARKKRKPSSKVEPCARTLGGTCSNSGCSGCQTNLRRATKRKGMARIKEDVDVKN